MPPPALPIPPREASSGSAALPGIRAQGRSPMPRRAEALLDPTDREPEPPPAARPNRGEGHGLWPFYWHFIRQEGWLVVALFIFGGLIAVVDVTIPAFIGRTVGLVSSHAPDDLLSETW